MKKREIHFYDGEMQVALVVGQATYAQDLQHAALVGEALAREKATRAGDLAGVALYQHNARAFVLPALQAATRSASLTQDGQITPIGLDAETIFSLPGDLVDEWINAVYDLNPRWNPFREDDAASAAEATQKKA